MSVLNTFVSNLKVLGMDQAIHCQGVYSNVLLQQEEFVLNTRSFEVTSHFLLRCLDKNKAKKEFRGCWPPRTKQHSREYSNAVFRWLQDLKQTKKESLLFYTPLRKSYFEDWHSPNMSHIMMALSIIVLECVLSRSMAIDINFLDKKSLENEIQGLSDKVFEKVKDTCILKEKWRLEGESIMKKMEETPIRSGKGPEKADYVEVKLQLENTLQNIKKKQLFKAKASKSLGKTLAQIMENKQEIDPLFILLDFPKKGDMLEIAPAISFERESTLLKRKSPSFEREEPSPKRRELFEREELSPRQKESFIREEYSPKQKESVIREEPSPKQRESFEREKSMLIKEETLSEREESVSAREELSIKRKEPFFIKEEQLPERKELSLKKRESLFTREESSSKKLEHSPKKSGSSFTRNLQQTYRDVDLSDETTGFEKDEQIEHQENSSFRELSVFNDTDSFASLGDEDPPSILMNDSMGVSPYGTPHRVLASDNIIVSPYGTSPTLMDDSMNTSTYRTPPRDTYRWDIFDFTDMSPSHPSWE